MNTALSWFIRIWVGLVVILNLVGIVSILIASPTVGDAWNNITEIYSPFNVINVIAEVVALSPALGAYLWLEKRKKQQLASR
jgi:hypothetical protein